MKQKIRKEGNYEKCWNYLKESRKYFLIVILVFFISFLVGFFFPVFFVEEIEKFVRDLLEKTSGMNFFQLFLFILQNNLITAFICLLFGVFLGLFPLLMTFMNGYVLGFVSGRVVDVVNLGVLLRLLPHGIFEMPALIISLGLGLQMARFVFAKSGKRKKQLKYDLENSLRVFLCVVLPLLIIAAVIEAGLMFLWG